MARHPELLIPASSLEVLKTAVIFGADAVYIGGEAFGLRAKAKNFSMEEIRDSRHVPHCKNCKTMIRPGTSLYGEMVDSSIMSRTTEEIARADVLLVLGTSLRSEVYSNYIRYFQGRKMVIIHRIPRPLDEKADMVIYDLPQNVLPLLVDGGI